MISLFLAAAVAAAPAPATTERLEKYNLEPIEALQKKGDLVQRVSFQGPIATAPNAPAVSLTLGFGGFAFIDLSHSLPPGSISVPVEKEVWTRLAARQSAAYAAAKAAPPALAPGCDLLVLETVIAKGRPAQTRYLSSCDTGPASTYAQDLLDIAARSIPCASKEKLPAAGRLAGCYGAPLPTPSSQQ